jgi:Fe-S cluster assembly protein SufD
MNTTTVERMTPASSATGGAPAPVQSHSGKKDDRKTAIPLSALRERSLAAYAEMEWPARKDEAWRQTPVSLIPLERFKFAPVMKSAEPDSVAAGKPEAGNFTSLAENPADWSGVLSISGVPSRDSSFRGGASLEPELAALGIELGLVGGNRKLPNGEGIPEPLEEEPGRGDDDRFQRLHWAALSHAARLSVPARVSPPRPILIEAEASDPGALLSPHLWIELGTLAEATVVVHWGGGENSALDTGLTLALADGAILKLVVVQDLPDGSFRVDSSRAYLGANAKLEYLDVSFGAAVTKTGFSVFLDGEGANASASGMYGSKGKEHRDISLLLGHRAPRTFSRANYKGTARDSGRAIFQGLIEVKENGTDTDAYLSNRNLILSEGARAVSLPQLKIGTNDLKCGHGSTTGRLDDEELFYLETRGFSPEDAKLIVAMGLFGDLIDSAPAPIRARLEALAAAAILDEGGRKP